MEGDQSYLFQFKADFSQAIKSWNDYNRMVQKGGAGSKASPVAGLNKQLKDLETLYKSAGMSTSYFTDKQKILKDEMKKLIATGKESGDTFKKVSAAYKEAGSRLSEIKNAVKQQVQADRDANASARARAKEQEQLLKDTARGMREAAKAQALDSRMREQEEKRSLAMAKKTAQEKARIAEEEIRNRNRLIASIGLTAAAYKGSQLLMQGMQTGFDFNAMIENSQMAFTVMLKSSSAADAMLGKLKTLQAQTGIGIAEGADAVKQMLAYGFGTGDMIDNLKMLKTVANAVNVPLKDLTYVYGTLRSQNRLYSRDLMQFTMRGIPLIEALANVLNVSTSEVKNLVESGAVNFKEVEQAMKNMTGAGGNFFGMLEEGMKTMTGRLNLFEKTWQSTMGMMMGESQSPLKNFFNDMTNAITELEPEFKGIGSGIAEMLKAGLPTVVELFKLLVNTLGMLVTIATPVVQIISQITKSLAVMSPLIVPLLAFFGAKWAMGLPLFAKMLTVISPIATAFTTATTAIGGFRAAVGMLQTTMISFMATPAGAMLTALGAIAAVGSLVLYIKDETEKARQASFDTVAASGNKKEALGKLLDDAQFNYYVNTKVEQALRTVQGVLSGGPIGAGGRAQDQVSQMMAQTARDISSKTGMSLEAVANSMHDKGMLTAQALSELTSEILRNKGRLVEETPRIARNIEQVFTSIGAKVGSFYQKAQAESIIPGIPAAPKYATMPNGIRGGTANPVASVHAKPEQLLLPSANAMVKMVLDKLPLMDTAVIKKAAEVTNTLNKDMVEAYNTDAFNTITKDMEVLYKDLSKEKQGTPEYQLVYDTIIGLAQERNKYAKGSQGGKGPVNDPFYDREFMVQVTSTELDNLQLQHDKTIAEIQKMYDEERITKDQFIRANAAQEVLNSRAVAEARIKEAHEVGIIEKQNATIGLRFVSDQYYAQRALDEAVYKQEMEMLQEQYASYAEKGDTAGMAKVTAIAKGKKRTLDSTKEEDWSIAAKQLQQHMSNWQPVVTAAQGMYDSLMTLQQQYEDAQIKSFQKIIDFKMQGYENQIALAKAAGEDTTVLEQAQADEKWRLQVEMDARQTELARARFEREKQMQMAQAAMSTAQAVVGALASAQALTPIGAIAMAGIIGAMGMAQIVNISHQQFPGLKDGGTVTQGGATWVGEEGPELLQLPTASKVTPLDKLGGGGDVINISGNTFVGVGGVDDLVRMIFTRGKQLDRTNNL